MSGTSRFDCYPSDFLTGVKGLEAHLVGVYTVIMMMQYDSGEPVPYIGRERYLAGPLLMTRARFVKTVDELIALGKLEVHDGALSNPRTASELIKIRAKNAQNFENAKKGGEMTRQKYQKKPNEDSGDDGPNGGPSAGRTPSRPPGPIPSPSTKEERSSSTDPNPASASAAAATTDLSDLEVRCCQAAALPVGLPGFDEVVALALSGVSIEGRILPAIRRSSAKRGKRSKLPPIATWFYFLPAIREQQDIGTAPKPIAVDRVFVRFDSEGWRAWQEHHRVARTVMPSPVPSRAHHCNGYWFASEFPPAAEVAA